MFLASVRVRPQERKRSLPGDLLIPDAAATVNGVVMVWELPAEPVA